MIVTQIREGQDTPGRTSGGLWTSHRHLRNMSLTTGWFPKAFMYHFPWKNLTRNILTWTNSASHSVVPSPSRLIFLPHRWNLDCGICETAQVQFCLPFQSSLGPNFRVISQAAYCSLLLPVFTTSSVHFLQLCNVIHLSWLLHESWDFISGAENVVSIRRLHFPPGVPILPSGPQALHYSLPLVTVCLVNVWRSQLLFRNSWPHFVLGTILHSEWHYLCFPFNLTPPPWQALDCLLSQKRSERKSFAPPKLILSSSM